MPLSTTWSTPRRPCSQCKVGLTLEVLTDVSLTRSEAVARIADRSALQHLWGSRDDIGHVTIWYLICHFLYWWSLGTESLSQTVVEILRSKRTGVTSLTFQSHVTSSDSPYAISYWWSFGNKPLSLTVSEIFGGECNAMVDMTWCDL